ncbi:MAG: tetratricopeptide repeat protein [Flavobacteriales bacterium]|nr:tetratricopeptide repeat protein [Flavobacteriales bacterium]
MYKFILTICLLIPAFLLGEDYNIDIDSLNKNAEKYITIELDSAYYFANRSVVLSKHHQYKQGEMDGTFQLGRIYLDQARRVLALESGIESLKIADEIDSYKGRKNACNLLIKIYNHSNKLDEGLKISNLILNLAKEKQDSIQIAKTYNFVGIFKRKMGEPDSSIYYKIESMKINRLLNDYKALAYNYTSLGIYHYDNGNLDTAFSYLRKSLQIRKKLNLIPQLIEANNNIGYLFLMLRTADSAAHYFQKSIDLCLTHEKHANLVVLYGNLSEAYKISGDHELALNAIEKSIPIKDSLMGIKQHEQIVKREKMQYQELHNEIEIVSAFSMNPFLLIFSLILALLFSIYLSRVSKKKTIKFIIEKQKTNAAKAIIDQYEKIDNWIAKELHDDIGGSIAAIRLNMIRTLDVVKSEAANKLNNPTFTMDISKLNKIIADKEDELENLKGVQDNIRDLSHSLVPVSFDGNNFIHLIENKISSRFSKDINCNIQTHPKDEINNISNDLKFNVYRILQNLAANIIKHSKAKNASLQVIGHEDHLTIIVEDDGVGFNPNNTNAGVGLDIIEKRALLFDGKVEIDSKEGSGSTIIVDLPYKII